MLSTTKMQYGMQYPNKDPKGTKIMPDVNGEPVLNKDLCTEIAIVIFHNLKAKMVCVRERHQDEKEHEQIADYGIMFEKNIKDLGGTFVEMKAQPFGLIFKVDEQYYQIIATNKKYRLGKIHAPKGKEA